MSYSAGSEDVEDSEPRKKGKAGRAALLFFAFAFFSLIWATIDISLDLRSWVALFAQFIGGLVFCYVLGVRARRLPVGEEIIALGIGLAAGIFSSAMTAIVLAFGGSFSVYENVWLTLLAPVSEVLALNIFIYHLIDWFFPESGFWLKAASSDLPFSFLHWFHYGDHPMFIVILIALIIGNTAIMWSYDLTLNVAAPILAHYVINLNNSWDTIAPAFVVIGEYFLIIMFGVTIIYIIFEVIIKKWQT
jgi:hypothetical protein